MIEVKIIFYSSFLSLHQVLFIKFLHHSNCYIVWPNVLVHSFVLILEVGLFVKFYSFIKIEWLIVFKFCLYYLSVHIAFIRQFYCRMFLLIFMIASFLFTLHQQHSPLQYF